MQILSILRSLFRLKIVPARHGDLARAHKLREPPDIVVNPDGYVVSTVPPASSGGIFVIRDLLGVRGVYIAKVLPSDDAIYMTRLRSPASFRAVAFEHFRSTYGGKGETLGIILRPDADPDGQVAAELRRAGFRRARATAAGAVFLWHPALG